MFYEEKPILNVYIYYDRCIDIFEAVEPHHDPAPV
jgi:hypothetical protein